MKLIDEVTIVVKAGDGGKGCESFRRLSQKKMIPTGGAGGAGGNVTIRTDANVTSLRRFLHERHHAAECGGSGGSNGKRGKKGLDLVISVPCGTVVYQKEKRFLIRDLIRPREEVVVLQGGRGGTGNEKGKAAQPGQKGESLEIILTLKILADIFLIGLPNAGKSKFLNRLTRTHIKEESYPFSTTEPQIGTYETPDLEQIRICELPSLYRESTRGRGAGVDFLKHLHRAKLLLLMLDPVNAFAASLQEGYEILLEALGRYERSFLEIPRVVAVNKIDRTDARERLETENFQPSCPLFLISVETGEGVEPLIRVLTETWKKLSENA